MKLERKRGKINKALVPHFWLQEITQERIVKFAGIFSSFLLLLSFWLLIFVLAAFIEAQM